MSEPGIAEADVATSDPRSVMRAAVPSWRRMLVPVLAGIASAGSVVALLAASAWLITRAAEQPPILYLSLGVVGVRAFALSRAVFRYIERVTGHDAAFRQLATIRIGIFERMLPLAPDGLLTSRRGELLARFVGDVDELQNVALRAVQPVVSAVVVLGAAVVGLAWLSPWSAVAVGGCLVVGIVLSLVVQRAAGAFADRRLAPLRGRLQSAIVEHVRALEVLVAFGADGDARRRIDALGRELERETLRRAAVAGAVGAVMTAIAGIAVAVSLSAGHPLFADEALSGPAFAVLCLVPLAIVEVAAALPPAAAALRLARASADRVQTVVPDHIPRELARTPHEPRQLGPRTAPVHLELRGVGAAWPSSDSAALIDVDLELAVGERVLVQGPSGAGKTTLAHVLVRLLEYSGEYVIDGVPARELDPDDVRTRIGLVEQTPWLFDESIRQNLLFARPEADDGELRAVLGRVGLADWAVARGGLDASVGERGAAVSGGQAQRLALARAMLAEFPVLVLDEPTASVDRERADALLSDLLGAAGEDRSVLVISHTGIDASLVDRTVTLVDGRTVPATSARARGPVYAE